MSDKLHYVNGRLLNFKYLENSYDLRDDEHLPRELYEYNDNKAFGLDNIDYLEILAPASVSTYKQAIYNGANAIYFGYGEFNARANAENFRDDMKALIDFCHFHCVKAYLALNINLKNEELNQVKDVIQRASLMKVDAFIITDLALVPYIRSFTQLQIHVSTQLGGHNVWGRDFLREFNIDRMILSREMTFADVRAVTDPSSVDTEVFVHGALCSCFSGACLLSSMLTGNSANRGKCNQLCRRRYKAIVNGKEVYAGYLLSAKDMCLDEYILPLADIGVTSVKIEGRLKRAEYVGGVTNYYNDVKHRVDNILTKDDVKVLFNRGNYTQGYFKDNNIIYTGQPNHIGVYAGKVVHLVNDYEAYVKSADPLEENNGYKVLRNMQEMGGAIATGKRVKGFSVIKSFFKLKVGDVVRLTSDETLATFLFENKKRKHIPVRLRIVPGELPTAYMNVIGQYVEVPGDEYVMPALKYPLMEEEIYDLIEGNRVREIKFIIVDIEMENAYLTRSQLNDFRRKMLDYAWRFMCGYASPDPLVFGEDSVPLYPEATSKKITGEFCEIDCADKLNAVRGIPNIVYAPYTYTKDNCIKFYKKAKRKNTLVFLKIPVYVPTTQEAFFEELVPIFDGVFANNIGAIYVAHKYSKLAVCGPNLNITNTKTWFIKNTASYVVSTELKYADIKKFKNPLVYTYGYLPLMHLNYCPRRLAGMDCSDCNQELKFRDERGEYLLSTLHFNGYCEHVLHNDRLTDIGSKYRVRHYFDFTLSTSQEIETILRHYNGKELYKPADSNKLHLTRGI